MVFNFLVFSMLCAIQRDRINAIQYKAMDYKQNISAQHVRVLANKNYTYQSEPLSTPIALEVGLHSFIDFEHLPCHLSSLKETRA